MKKIKMSHVQIFFFPILISGGRDGSWQVGLKMETLCGVYNVCQFLLVLLKSKSVGSSSLST